MEIFIPDKTPANACKSTLVNALLVEVLLSAIKGVS